MTETDKNIPRKERIKLRDMKIRELYKMGYSMDEICVREKVSKTTVFFAIKGRRPTKKKPDSRKALAKLVNKK